jgi:putative FmdB family regulatory protein
MPTYEYACQKCGHHFEKFQTMSAGHLKKCPKCGKPGLKRLIGAGAGLIFKGTGFYITDYKKTQTPPAGGEGKPAGDGGKLADKAGETKAPAKEAVPAPKSEIKPKP